YSPAWSSESKWYPRRPSQPAFSLKPGLTRSGRIISKGEYTPWPTLLSLYLSRSQKHSTAKKSALASGQLKIRCPFAAVASSDLGPILNNRRVLLLLNLINTSALVGRASDRPGPRALRAPRACFLQWIVAERQNLPRKHS